MRKAAIFDLPLAKPAPDAPVATVGVVLTVNFHGEPATRAGNPGFARGSRPVAEVYTAARVVEWRIRYPSLTLSPDDAFGLHDPALITTIAKKDFPPGVKVGGQLQGCGEDGKEHVFNVMKIKGDTVHLDGNHPLAGKDLRFTVKVMEVRTASAEEIAHKHVHGAHGHQH